MLLLSRFSPFKRARDQAKTGNIALGGPCGHGRRQLKKIRTVFNGPQSVVTHRCETCAATRISLRTDNLNMAIGGADFPWTEWLTPSPEDLAVIKRALRREFLGACGLLVLAVLAIAEVLVGVRVSWSEVPAPTFTLPSTDRVEQAASTLDGADDALTLLAASHLSKVYWRLITSNVDRCGPDSRNLGAFFSAVTMEAPFRRSRYASPDYSSGRVAALILAA